MKSTITLLILSVFLASCDTPGKDNKKESNVKKLSVIFDTDANNELDDQHALAYLFSNQDFFDIKAVTVSATRNGGNIQGHYDEAKRIFDLLVLINHFLYLKVLINHFR